MGPGVLQGKVPPGGRLRLSPPTCCLQPPAPATHPHPRPFPCLPVRVETCPPQGLRPGGLYSRGPWLNTAPACFLQSLRLCHPKTDAQTSSCAPRYAQPGAPNCRPGVPGVGPSLPGVYFPGSHPPSGPPQHQEDEAGTEGLLGGTWGRADIPWGSGARGRIWQEHGPWGTPAGLWQRPKHPEGERPWTCWCPHTLTQVGKSWAWGPVGPLQL